MTRLMRLSASAAIVIVAVAIYAALLAYSTATKVAARLNGRTLPEGWERELVARWLV